MPALLDFAPASGTASRNLRFSNSDEPRGSVYLFDASSGTSAAIPRWVIDSPLRRRFFDLADQWHEETDHLASPSKRAMHPAYQRIISMGERVIPFILEDLRRRGGDWYWALGILSGESPVSSAISGNMRLVEEVWLDWGKRKGYLDN